LLDSECVPDAVQRERVKGLWSLLQVSPAGHKQRLQGAIALLRLFGLTPSPMSISESQPAQ
jgi:hypothetical protein